MITGLKLLNGTWSLNGQVDYSQALAGEWQEVPGHGAYVAHDGGLWSSTHKPVEPRYVVLACKGEVPDMDTPSGVRCWRSVRWLREATAEDLIPLARQDPCEALYHAAAPLVDVIPSEVWAELALQEPWWSLVYASGPLRDVLPAGVWAELALQLALQEPWTALRYAAGAPWQLK